MLEKAFEMLFNEEEILYLSCYNGSHNQLCYFGRNNGERLYFVAENIFLVYLWYAADVVMCLQLGLQISWFAWWLGKHFKAD